MGRYLDRYIDRDNPPDFIDHGEILIMDNELKEQKYCKHII